MRVSLRNPTITHNLSIVQWKPKNTSFVTQCNAHNIWVCKSDTKTQISPPSLFRITFQFPQKSPMITGSFAARDVQLKVFLYEYIDQDIITGSLADRDLQLQPAASAAGLGFRV